MAENNGAAILNFTPDLICDYFGRLERQGPGSPESTVRALHFIDGLSDRSEIADLACGTGGQTITLAQNTKGNITGLDIFPAFITEFDANIKRHGFQDRVKGIAGSMDALPFGDKKFDVIWSEGAIANIGFEKGLTYWKSFLKEGGYIAVTYESWFTDERPAEIEKFWVDAVPEINTIGHNISVMQRAGYKIIAAFSLPESCWTDTYFAPQKAMQKAFLEDNAQNAAAQTFVDCMKHEAELYAEYKQYYGYVFYIGRTI
ncbi:MAG: class I SAM-dependent methyltransferase [Treponema sp.]|nr:class I SAM-dependent methyltransferase [Treponema sp.]